MRELIMFNRFYFLPLLLIISIFFIDGCKKNSTSSGNGNASITVDWSSQYTCTYNYSSGILRGQTCFIGFTVTSGSGSLKLEAEVTKGNGNTKSIMADVVNGKHYSLRVPISFSGTQNCTPGTVAARIEITAGNSDPQSITISCEFSGRAPNTLTIGDLTI